MPDANDIARDHGLDELRRQMDAGTPLKNGRRNSKMRNRDQQQSDAKPDMQSPPPAPINPTPFFWRDLGDIQPRPWLFAKHLIRGYVTITIGKTGLGKTALVATEILAMVTGRALMGACPPTPLRVWYVGEDPVSELEMRIRAACLHHNIEQADIGDRLMVDSTLDGTLPRMRIVEQRERGVVVNSAMINALIAGMKANRIDVLVLDPLIKFHGVPESDNSAMEQVIDALTMVARSTQAAVEILHHIRKPGAGQNSPATIDDGRGATAVNSGARSARVVNGMSTEEADIQTK